MRLKPLSSPPAHSAAGALRLALTRALPIVLAATFPTAAHAQNVGDNFVTPNLPLEYDRGQNVGVLDRPRLYQQRL